MVDWTSVIAVFWVLWAVDCARLLPHAVFTLVGGFRRPGGRFNRWSIPGPWPWNWRAIVADVPLSLSPAGVCNRPAGTVGRPADVPTSVVAWRWEAVREVGVARGWIFINGAKFCRHTGHVSGAELLALARSRSDVREERIHAIIARWFRPAHLRRRSQSLRGRTATAVTLNTAALLVLGAISIYVVADAASRLPTRWSDLFARVLPYLLVYVAVLHVVAVVSAWRATKRLKIRGVDRRAAGLFSALMLPPQGLRLRMLAGDGYFPAAHPLAAALAWCSPPGREEWAFRALADLRWPIGGRDDAPNAREVNAWFRTALEARIIRVLGGANIAIEPLFASPIKDAAASCSYCPRCRDQFAAGPTHCPHGIELRPVRTRDG